MRGNTKAYLALVFICIVWGTTYLSLRVAVQHYPSILFAAIRQTISAVIIMLIGYLVSRKTDLSIANLKHQAIVGFCLITVGNGLVSWGERVIPSGVAALICSMMPMCAVIINLASSKREKVNPQIIIGMLIGFCGVGLIFKDNIADLGNSAYLTGILSIFAATSTWAFGSVYNKKGKSTINPIFNAGLQLAFGGTFLYILSPFIDDYSSMDFFSPDVIWPMLYLVTFGSVMAYTAYMYTLKELPVGIVSLYAYVNPLVAVVLGYMVLNEQLTWLTAAAFVTIALGVYIVNSGYRKQHKITQRELAALQTVPDAE
ncbi:MAG: EamA family transporter [Bacteroidetes bacterium]|nr:EamA family transporter [Bacteroidota bacterium]